MRVPPLATAAEIKDPRRAQKLSEQALSRALAKEIQDQWRAIGHHDVIVFSEEAHKAHLGPTGRYVPAVWRIRSNLVNGLPPSAVRRAK